MSDIQVGDPVIINHVDRPCTRLIAIVTDISKELVKAHYLCEQCSTDTCTAIIDRVTPIYLFGVSLFIKNDGTIYSEHGYESFARYRDGSIRPWQPEHNDKYLTIKKSKSKKFNELVNELMRD